jgi:hypothetical protein
MQEGATHWACCRAWAQERSEPPRHAHACGTMHGSATQPTFHACVRACTPCGTAGQGQMFIDKKACGSKRHIGRYASEKDTARAYDCAAVQANGPGAKCNFPGEAISEPPVTVGEERKDRSSSRFIGFTWLKANSSRGGACGWRTHRPSIRSIGLCFASEKDSSSQGLRLCVCRRTNQAPGATFRARPSASCL